MSGAFRIARVLNIPVRVHWTFFVLILGYVFFAGYHNDWDRMAMFWSGTFVLVLFFLVVLHEFGHALMARRFGVNTRDIILLPIGGVARLDHLPEKPAHEFWVAIAGPLVNMAIAALLSLYLLNFTPTQRWEIINGVVFADGNFFLDDYSNVDRFLFFMAWLNVILAAFNLIPAFPMDGGRILRAILSIWLKRVTATMIAARIGQIMALGMIAFGAWPLKPMYILIGLFVLFTAENEYRAVRTEALVAQLKVQELMRVQFSRIYTTDLMQVVLEIYQQGVEKNFLVFDEWQNLKGVLPEFKLQEARRKKDGQALVRQYMLAEIYPILSEENLRKAFGVLQRAEVGALPVYNPWNRLIGVIDEYHFSRALKQKRPNSWLNKD